VRCHSKLYNNSTQPELSDFECMSDIKISRENIADMAPLIYGVGISCFDNFNNSILKI
jgi:hypothetical protein